jgi:hypothetical protein
MVGVASKEATMLHHRVSDGASFFIDHQALYRANFLAVAIIDHSSFYAIARDKGMYHSDLPALLLDQSK